MGYSIGYFANTKRWTKVHIIKQGKPICNSNIKNNMQYQWCSNIRHFPINLDYTNWIECKHCLKWVAKKNAKAIERTLH